MGMAANYMLVDAKELDALLKLKGDELYKRLEKMEEDEGRRVLDLDKIWDGLHYFLTGLTADGLDEVNPLSDAVMGGELLPGEEDDLFVACTRYEELPGILAHLKDADLGERAEAFSPEAYREKDIYPDIWHDEDRDELLGELTRAASDLLAFYQEALEKKMNVIVSIY